jgi:molybdopterin synthase sulfur carrier subunit
MATVYIPSLVRDLTGGADPVTVAGGNVRELLERLETKYPGMRRRLCDGEQLRRGLAVVVDGQWSAAGLEQVVGPASEVHFVPAIAGGAG